MSVFEFESNDGVIYRIEADDDEGEEPIDITLPAIPEATADEGKKCVWDESHPTFVPASDAMMLANGLFSLCKLSKTLKPDGPVHYMRKGQRCMVHIGDFCRMVFAIRKERESEAREETKRRDHAKRLKDATRARHPDTQ